MINTNGVSVQETGFAANGFQNIDPALKSEGRLSGMTVSIEQDPVAAVQDAAEEATFGHDNSKKMKLEDRKQKSRISALLIERAAAFAKLIQDFHNADFDARHRVLEQSKSSRTGDPRRILADLRKLGGRPSTDYAFLVSAYRQEKDPDFQKLLKDASEELFREKSSEILATLNSADVAVDNSMGDRLYLAESYGELSTMESTPEKMLDYIQRKFGEDRIDDGIEFMLKSLGADMASPMSSAEPTVLELVGSNLSTARSLNSGKSILGGFVNRLGSAHGLKTVMSPATLLKGVLDISRQRFITPASVRALYSVVPQQRPDTEVLLAQDLLGACRNLSSEIFDSDESRIRVIDALEQLVDGLVDEEDKWLEAGADA